MGAFKTEDIRAGALRALTLVVLAGTLAGCLDSNPTATTATISVQVNGDGEGLAGVDVTANQDGGLYLATQTTDAGGETAFSDLDPGTYDVSIAVPNGYQLIVEGSDRQTVNIFAGTDITLSFNVESSTGVGTGDVVEIHLTSQFSFSPEQVSIEPGTTVRWINDASIYHTVTPDGHSQWQEAELDQEGQTFSHTFELPGDYGYYCVPHQYAGMEGAITVTTGT